GPAEAGRGRPGGTGRPALSRVDPTARQPLPAPPVMPRTKYRCRLRNTMIGMTIEMNAAAVKYCQPPPNEVVRVASTTDSGWFWGTGPRDTRATSRAIQRQRHGKMMSDASAGTLIGRASLKNAVPGA